MDIVGRKLMLITFGAYRVKRSVPLPQIPSCMRRRPIPPVERGFVTRICTVFGQFCTEGITFSGGSRPPVKGGGGGGLIIQTLR